jgi:hypothetical protein
MNADAALGLIGTDSRNMEEASSGPSSEHTYLPTSSQCNGPITIASRLDPADETEVEALHRSAEPTGSRGILEILHDTLDRLGREPRRTAPIVAVLVNSPGSRYVSCHLTAAQALT